MYSDVCNASQVLSNLFAVKSELSDSKFELKVNDVRFVGHPLRLNPTSVHFPTQAKRKPSTIILVNIVFALKVCLCILHLTKITIRVGANG